MTNDWSTISWRMTVRAFFAKFHSVAEPAPSVDSLVNTRIPLLQVCSPKPDEAIANPFYIPDCTPSPPRTSKSSLKMAAEACKAYLRLGRSVLFTALKARGPTKFQVSYYWHAEQQRSMRSARGIFLTCLTLTLCMHSASPSTRPRPRGWRISPARPLPVASTTRTRSASPTDCLNTLMA